MKYYRSVFALIFVLALATSYWLPATSAVNALTESEIQAQEAKWRAELEATEKEIAQWEAVLETSKQGTASLERDANVLKAKINEAKAFIRQRQIQIEQLTQDISLKNKTIAELEEKMEKGKESLAAMLRQKNEIDAYSLVEVMLSNKNLSEFFVDIDTYNSISDALENQFNEIRELQGKTAEEREVLAQKRTAEADKKAEVETQKKVVERDEAEKQRLISINKSQEMTYEQVIKQKQQQAAQIRAALFALRDTEGIPFGDALNYATAAYNQTGVRPALILAILMQESDLGKNQGSCLVANLDTGDGNGKNTGTFFERVMKAPRDTVPFKSITDRLGRDWKMTPVSCPPGTVYTSSRGYGGGMGPSQFIPSTWELFKSKVGSALGVGADSADPWNPAHSFMATAIYLKELGANASSYTSERNAACRYYSGRACDNRAPANTFYGNQVMAKAQDIQLNMIDPLEGF